MKWFERLKIARKARKLSLTAFALKVGVAIPTASEWESGKVSTLKSSNMEKVCEVLNITPAWLNGKGSIEELASPSRKQVLIADAMKLLDEMNENQLENAVLILSSVIRMANGDTKSSAH